MSDPKYDIQHRFQTAFLYTITIMIFIIFMKSASVIYLINKVPL